MKYYIALLLLLISSSSFAENTTQSERKKLESFPSIQAFENYLEESRSECLDKSYGGSRAIACFKDSKIWDEELNYYYKLLRSKLNTREKEILKKAQLEWIKHRDSTIEFNSKVLDREYAGKRGTMYSAFRADEASATITPIIKERTLLLKNWYERISKTK